MRIRFVQIILASLFVLSQSAFALEYYRYKDENGVMTIDAAIPPEYVKYGYEVLNSMGIVVRVQPPELSDEEKQIQERRKKEAAEFEALKNRLNRLYRSPADVDRAMRLFEARIIDSIAAQKRRRDMHQEKLDAAEKKIGREEAHQKPVSQIYLDEMEEAAEYIHSIELSIAEKKEEILEKRIIFKYERDVMFIVYKERRYEDYIDVLTQDEIDALYYVPPDFVPKEQPKTN